MDYYDKCEFQMIRKQKSILKYFHATSTYLINLHFEFTYKAHHMYDIRSENIPEDNLKMISPILK